MFSLAGALNLNSDNSWQLAGSFDRLLDWAVINIVLTVTSFRDHLI